MWAGAPRRARPIASYLRPDARTAGGKVIAMVERIDLNQARRRAKELLRAWRAEGRADAKLADAQHEVARGMGAASWPALVRRVEAEALKRGERHAQFVRWATDGPREHVEELLALDPALAEAGLDAALVVGNRDRVAAEIESDPGLVGRELGELGWLPLVYVCHSVLLGGPRADDLVACAELLLDSGADPDGSRRHPKWGDLSALYGAAGVAHEPRMTALLLERGASPDDDESLYHSCETRDHSCLLLLLEAGARVDGTNSIRHMLDYDDLEGLRLLLERGVAQEGHGWPELDGTIEWALIRDRSRAHVELLLEHGAPVRPGEATLAVRRGRADLADLLGEAQPKPADELLGALRRGDRPAADAVLGAHAGLLETLGRGDHDVLVHAAGRGRREAVELMLELGFPVDIRSEEWGETPLHAAAWYGFAEIVRVLLAHGADPRAAAGEPFGGTPLEWAERGSREADHSVLGVDSEPDYDAVLGLLA
jgi:Ankyrin repeats (3 copies)